MAREKPIEFLPWDELKEQIGEIPDGTGLELMVKFTTKPGGRWCIVAIEGVAAPGYDSQGKPANKEEHMETGQFASKYNEAMGS